MNPSSDEAPHSGDREARLAARVAELEQALRLRDELLSIAAHELRNPMHTLLLQVSAALEVARRNGDADLIRRVERLRFTVDRYVKRASVLLDVCRMNAQRFVVEVERVDLAEVVREVADSYASEAAFHRCTVSLDLPDSLPGEVDRLALEQIVGNLLSNAFKYGAGRPVEITLRGEGGEARLEVRDHGIGIAESDHERIFESFEQVVRGSARRQGVGLGLWLVRGLVRAQGGSVVVESAAGQGARFIVRLPLRATSGEDASDG